MWAPSLTVSSRMFLPFEVESIENEVRMCAACVGVVEFDVNGAPFAGHERNVVVVVKSGRDGVAGFLADGFDAHHERGRRRCVAQIGDDMPLRAGLSDVSSHGDMRGCERADASVFVFCCAMQIEVGAEDLVAA